MKKTFDFKALIANPSMATALYNDVYDVKKAHRGDALVVLDRDSTFKPPMDYFVKTKNPTCFILPSVKPEDFSGLVREAYKQLCITEAQNMAEYLAMGEQNREFQFEIINEELIKMFVNGYQVYTKLISNIIPGDVKDVQQLVKTFKSLLDEQGLLPLGISMRHTKYHSSMVFESLGERFCYAPKFCSLADLVEGIDKMKEKLNYRKEEIETIYTFAVKHYLEVYDLRFDGNTFSVLFVDNQNPNEKFELEECYCIKIKSELNDVKDWVMKYCSYGKEQVA